ncbi:MAG: hypothetical protein IJ302_04140, partial [Clostridia bacterium]|nr:hypothetical protein [Clostridia bacterium]
IVHIILYLLAAGMALGVGLWLYRYGMWVAIVSACILYLPFYALCRELADTAAARFGRRFGLPVLRYRLEQLPEDGKTLVVVTALLRGGAHDRALIRNLERFFLRCRDENLCIGLLGDLPAAESEITDADAAVIAAAKEQIAALNRKYGGAFCLFVRGRTWSAGEEIFCGWERKRGAVLTLARYLRSVIGEDAFAAVLAPRIPVRELRYVCTLDEDTELPPGAVAEMVGVMLHPYHRPQVHAGAVRRGCAIVQPAMAVTLAGAAATRFTLLCTGKGGSDPYSRHNTDGESILYGMGSFCGKGLFDVDAYLAVLDRAFPEGAVLSHDFLEGARLGCRNLPDVVFSDRIPTRVGAYFSRQSRWIRGDIQALRFAFRRHKNADGEITDNPISHTARQRMIDHALYALIPAAVLRGALVLSFLPVPHGVTFLLWGFLFSSRLLRPLLLCLQPWAWRSLLRQFYGFVYTDLRQGILWLWFRVQFAAHEGWINTKAIAAALYRMLISKKHLLEWVTAGEAEAGADAHTFPAQLRTMRVSLVLGAVLVLFSPHISSKVIGLIWLCAPWAAEHYSAPPQTRITRRQ